MPPRPGFVGARITKNNIGGLETWLRQEVSQALQAGCERILEVGTELAPERSGELKGSGKVKQNSLLGFQVTWGEGLPDARAVYQELGTHNAPAQPYATPAVDQEAPSIVEDIAQRTQGRVRHTNVRVASQTGIQGGFMTNDVEDVG